MRTAKPYNILVTMSEFMYGSKIRNVCDLVRGLDRSKYNVAIAALETTDEAVDEIRSLGVPYYRLRTILRPPITGRRVGQFLASPFEIVSHKYDLVHSFLYQSLATEAVLFKLFSRAKYIYTKPNLQWDNHRLNWHLKSRLSDKIISISKATDELLICKGFGDKIRTIYLGIDISLFQFSEAKRVELRRRLGIGESPIVFGCAAQFVESKEQLTLVSAFEALHRRYENVRLLLAGPNHKDQYYRTVVERIESSPAKATIILLGTIQDMAAFYSGIDCFVLPSRNESFGYVYIEAMSCGRPVIASRAGGPLDIVVEGETGHLTEMSSVHDLTEKMGIYLKNKDLLCDHGRAGRQRAVAVFSRETMVDQTQSLYMELLTS